MTLTKKAGNELKRRIIRQAYQNAGVIHAAQLAKEAGVSRQSVYRHMGDLMQSGAMTRKKEGRNYIFELRQTFSKSFAYENAHLSEDDVWRRDIAPLVDTVPETAKKVAFYVFTEMLNNAIEHSQSPTIQIGITGNAYCMSFSVADRGVGIFAKIQKAMGLSEKSYAILELAKGKFTTEPESHTGEGIFFSSKAADGFCILSDELMYFGMGNRNGVLGQLGEQKIKSSSGTTVLFEVALNREKTLKEVFQLYTEHPDDYGFTKTVIPIRLLEYHDASPVFVSRSQARRLIARFEEFENIILDFEEVAEIGQGFADEIFRVFQNRHPACKLTCINANGQVLGMVNHILSRTNSSLPS